MSQLAVIAAISMHCSVGQMESIWGHFATGKRGGHSSQSEEYDESVCIACLLMVPTLWSCRILAA